MAVAHPRVRFQTMDESLAKIVAAHKKALRASTRHPASAPKTLDECVAGFERFLTVAFDRISP